MIVIGGVVLIEIVVVLVISVTYLVANDIRIEFADFQPVMWKLARMMEFGHQFQSITFVRNVHIRFLFGLIFF